MTRCKNGSQAARAMVERGGIEGASGTCKAGAELPHRTWLGGGPQGCVKNLRESAVVPWFRAEETEGLEKSTNCNVTKRPVRQEGPPGTFSVVASGDGSQNSQLLR